MLPYDEFVKKYGKRPPDIVCALTQQDTLKAVGGLFNKLISGILVGQDIAKVAGNAIKGQTSYALIPLLELNKTLKSLKQGKFPEEVKP